MQNYTAAEVLMIGEAIRSCAAGAQMARAEAETVSDQQLRQFLQSEAERHDRSVQKLQRMLGQVSH